MTQESTIPLSVAEFQQWSTAEIQAATRGKSVIFSPGGSSRWYFMEHGDVRQGYLQHDLFQDYANMILQRILEIVHIMMSDGVDAVYVVAITPKIDQRTESYRQFIADGLRAMVNAAAQDLYEQYQMHVKFCGGWESILEANGIGDVLQSFKQVEKETAQTGRPRLIWCAEDKPLPDRLLPFVRQHLDRHDSLPDRETLAELYYGETGIHTDIFIGNNKPSIEGQIPPLLTLGDLYFTVSPSLYLDRQSWRSILYDHLFCRRVSYRDYTKITSESMAELRDFYHTNQTSVLGIGMFDDITQTWRPMQP